MRSNPQVKVTRLEREALVAPNAGFGATGILRANLNEVLDRHARDAREFFLLEWEGDETPRGAIINGASVVVATSGMLVGAGGKYIGVFERMIEDGGASGKEQKMVVAVR